MIKWQILSWHFLSVKDNILNWHLKIIFAKTLQTSITYKSFSKNVEFCPKFLFSSQIKIISLTCKSTMHANPRYLGVHQVLWCPMLPAPSTFFQVPKPPNPLRIFFSFFSWKFLPTFFVPPLFFFILFFYSAKRITPPDFTSSWLLLLYARAFGHRNLLLVALVPLLGYFFFIVLLSYGTCVSRWPKIVISSHE